MRFQRIALAISLATAIMLPAAQALPLAGDVAGTVTDSVTGQPLHTAEVTVSRTGQVVARAVTDNFGRYRLHDLPMGDYTLGVHLIGYRPVTRDLHLTGTSDVAADFRLTSAPLNMETIEVIAAAPVAVDTRTGDETFKADQFHGAPTVTTSQIIQQSIAGAVRAPTGEVHIRGQHAEYTYYVDGVPVPSGVSGSLNELFDPQVTNSINFKTGGWDAEYGGKMAAVVDVTTRVPTGRFHMDASSYGGSFASNGQGLSLSGNSGKLGYFFSGARQATDMRREPRSFDTLTNTPFNFHNHGEDLFGFGKLQHSGTNDVTSLDMSWSQTKFQVPFDSTGGVVADDHQKDINAFVNFGWRHSFPVIGEKSSELFTGVFYRHGSLSYVPGVGDSAQFIFFPDTLTAYNLSEDRAFNTVGAKVDYTIKPREHLEFKVGGLGSRTGGHENFVTLAADGSTGPGSVSNLAGWDAGGYVQMAIQPSEKWELRPGVRVDAHNAPFAGTLSQVSPRIRLNLFPSPSSSIWFYYGRLFMPTNVEELRAITSVAQAGQVTVPTLPERDHFFEVGLTHRFPAGLVTKLSGYYKRSDPGIDDNTIPGSAIITSVNIAQVRTTGLEAALEFTPRGPLSGYLNAALAHAYGLGPVTGGFFPAVPPSGYFDLDHDQRLSMLGNLTYSRGAFNLGVTEIYGSGLTNGIAPDSTYSTGLFAFNKTIKVDPSYITNASAGYSIPLGQTALGLQVFVDNIFDRKYLLKGAFFSGASLGRPRSIQLRANLRL